MPNSADTACARSNQDVFAHCGSALLEDLSAGFNACVIAYGETGSGKTHAMTGTPEDPGLMVRLIEPLLASKASDDAIDASYVEIYNEKVHLHAQPIHIYVDITDIHRR